MKKSAVFFFTHSALFFALISLGCYPRTKIPIETIRYDALNAQGARSLIVFLPGRGDSMAVFEKQGLVEAVRERRLPMDVIAVEAHIGYYADWSILTRLKEDIINPAKSRSYDQIWLIGNSMGAYGAISYAAKHQDDIAGIVMLGPFLGEKKLIDEIRQKGGLYSWDPGDIHSENRAAVERGIWAWIKGYGAKNESSPKIYIGYGRDDRFAYSQDYFASFLPPERVIAVDGGHDWRTWKKIWLMLLDKDIFRRKHP